MNKEEILKYAKVFSEARGDTYKIHFVNENKTINEPDLWKETLSLIDKLQNKLNTLENKLEEHIKFCEQEASGSLNNEMCYIALKFDKGLLNIIKENKNE